MGRESCSIRALLAEDWPAVRDILAEGIAGGNATFEQAPAEWKAWDAGHLANCRFVAVADAAVVGWAALSPVSNRCVYGGVVENSVYVAEQARGQRIGRLLLEHLISSTEEAGVWTILTGILPERGSDMRDRHAGQTVISRMYRPPLKRSMV